MRATSTTRPLDGLRTVLLPLLLLPSLAVALRSQESLPASDTPIVREFGVPLHEGRLSLAELVEALLDAYGFDPAGLPIPDRRIDVRGISGWLKLRACRELLLDCVSFRQTAEGDRLIVTIDRERSRTLRRSLRARIARMLGEDPGERDYALELPGALDTERPLVVLVHGVESGPGVWDDLREYLAEQEEPPQVATFRYPNDEACERIAQALAAELAALGEQQVVLVGHSMGGLVVRAVVEDPRLDPGNVDTVVMIGTPQQGSRLGALRFVLEAAAAAERLGQRSGDLTSLDALVDTMTAGLRDGLGEAGGDLMPGSVFLRRLDRHGRNPAVRYRVVLGTRGLLGEEQADALGERLAGALQGQAPMLIAPRVASWLADLDEIVHGRGDGAVSVARGRLDGVEPLLVPLDHVGLVRRHGLLGRQPTEGRHPVFERLAAWIAQAGRRG